MCFGQFIEINEGHGHIDITNINAILDKESQVADLGIAMGEKQPWGKDYLGIWLAVCVNLFCHE